MESHESRNAPQEISARRGRRACTVLGVIVVLTGSVLWWMGFGSYLQGRLEYAGKEHTFCGPSESLKQTVIVPTLDTPLPVGKNVIWCSSFQLAWNEVRDKVIGAPLDVVGAEEVAARLNAARQSVSDVDAGSVYAAGGRIRDGIIGRIEKGMASRFPSHRPPDFKSRPHFPEGILAYSYVVANVPFKYPFRQVGESLAFTDSQGIQTLVAGFGLWKAYLRPYRNLREQVGVLYAERDENRSEELTECALDLCRHSTPYQVVVARVSTRASLAEMLEHLRTQMASFTEPPYYESDRRFGVNDELRLPEMFWRIDHRFEELIDVTVSNSNPPMPIVEALQSIEFRLDRCGAVLESNSTLAVESGPRHFEFDQPFLVYMQKRGAAHPFFVMWVDNAELLVRR